MTIQRLRVRGFQSLDDVELELAPFTVVVGPSNSGKSALRRALEAVTTNAAATGRLRTGASQMTVEVELDDGTVVWEKGPKRNAYRVTPTGAAELVQDKPGSQVTPEATDLLGLDELNFVDQFDGPYLLDATPGGAAKILGELTNITVLYQATNEATRRAKEHAARAKLRTADLETARTELESYADLATEDQALRVAAAALGEAKTAEQRYYQVGHALEAARAHRATAQAAQELLGATVDPAPALAAAEAAVATYAHLAGQLTLATATSLRANVAVAPPVVLPHDLEALVVRSLDLNAARRSSAHVAEFITAAGAAVAEADAELAAAQAELATIDHCPLCGTVGAHLEVAT